MLIARLVFVFVYVFANVVLAILLRTNFELRRLLTCEHISQLLHSNEGTVLCTVISSLETSIIYMTIHCKKNAPI